MFFAIAAEIAKALGADQIAPYLEPLCRAIFGAQYAHWVAVGLASLVLLVLYSILASSLGLIRSWIWPSQTAVTTQSAIAASSAALPGAHWLQIYFLGAVALVWSSLFIGASAGVSLYCVGAYHVDNAGYVLILFLVGFAWFQMPQIVYYASAGRGGSYAVRLFAGPYNSYLVTVALYKGYQWFLGIPFSHDPDLSHGCFRSAFSTLFVLIWIVPGVVVFFTPHIRLLPRIRFKRRSEE